MLRKKISKILAVILLPFVVVGLNSVYQSTRYNEIYAVNPLTVTYNGDAPPDPMFEVYNMLPGDEEERVFNVINTSPGLLSVEMTAYKTDEEKEFADILDVEISEAGPETPVFSGKLEALFASPPINLGNYPANADKNFRVKVKFPPSSGNEYQNAFVAFNIVWRTQLPQIELPEECSHLSRVITGVIEGTNGRDRIEGTHASELIMSFDGNDKIDGGAGHDCIVTGNGNSKIDGGAGNDVIITGNGNNKIEDGGAGDDKIYTGSGNDKIGGGSGNDLIYSGEGNDNVYGDSGNDKIYGEEGNDVLRGDTGSDYLNGGPDSDKLFGGTGADDCDLGETLNSCEL